MAGKLQDGASVTLEYRISAHDVPTLVTENPTLAWEAGKELDSSQRRGQALTFEVGAKMVLPALDHAARTMNEGETKTLILPAGEVLEPDRCKDFQLRETQEVCCAVKIIERKDEAAALQEEVRFRFEQATNAKDRGNLMFKQKKPREALKQYRLGRSKLEGFDKANLERQDEDRCRALLVSLLLNSAACFLQLGESCAEQTIVICNKALSLEECSVKAFFRRAMAHKMQNNLEASMSDLRSALRLEPTNEDVMKEILKLGGADFEG